MDSLHLTIETTMVSVKLSRVTVSVSSYEQLLLVQTKVKIFPYYILLQYIKFLTRATLLKVRKKNIIIKTCAYFASEEIKSLMWSHTVENPDLVLQESGDSQGPTHSRRAECGSRQAIEARPNRLPHKNLLNLNLHQSKSRAFLRQWQHELRLLREVQQSGL